MEKGPSVEGWLKVAEATGLWGAHYGVYVSPDGVSMAEKDEDDGETAIVFNRKTWIISYIHPKTAEGGRMSGIKMEVGMSYKEIIDQCYSLGKRNSRLR